MPPIQLIPYREDPLAVLADQLLADHSSQLPQLDGVVVLLPDPTAAARLRQRLLQQAELLGFNALLGPRITTLREWVNEQPGGAHAVVHEHQRALILVDALREHRALFGNANLWALADTLLTLFDELTLNRAELPDSLGEFTRRIASGYGLQGDHPASLDREARLVHTLWHAWHQQLHARGLIEQHSRYLLQLSDTLKRPVEGHLYMAGLPTLNRAEEQWLERMLQNAAVTLLLHAEGGEEPPRLYHPNTPLSRLMHALRQALPAKDEGNAANALFDAIYNADAASSPMQERAAQFAATQPSSPIAPHLQLFHADGDEQEARAVDLQVRRWLLQGHTAIGIVTENRRLARRVRALLERAGVTLYDTSGWALSTTSAAATLEQWLQCVEEDFSHQPMLDLLKSPFIFYGEEREEHLNHVYRLEQDIVQHENIGSGIGRYSQQTRFRQHRLPADLAAGLDGVLAILARLEEGTRPLMPLLQGERPAAHYLTALLKSLQPLGLEQGLASDDAGVQLFDTLQQLQQAVQGEEQALCWLEFRGWLGGILEGSHFRLPSQGHAVSLMGLGQSQLQHFDGLIIAGMESAFLPGSPAGSPFFNDAVRQELQLPCSEQQQAERFFHFRRLLESSNSLLLTLRRQQDGEDIVPSPWLAALKGFHLLAYGDALEDSELAQWLHSPESEVVERSAPLPRPSQMPAPGLPPQLLPRHYSASAYQQLINCPYQFYAARGLRLAPPETIREALEKSDYGERVHRILQAFHGDLPNLPGPFTKRLDARTRDAAQQLLEEISHRVFAEDLEDNFLHRGWLQRWLEKIPAYLEWQMAREEAGRIDTVEAELRSAGFAPNLELQGRLDRIDHHHGALAVVDYKTGAIASEEEVLNGEAVQLPFYALLARHCDRTVSQVEYLALEEKKLGSKVVLQGAELEQLSQANAERLITLQSEMHGSQGLPAWGDEKVCGYCHMEGLCRRTAWPL